MLRAGGAALIILGALAGLHGSCTGQSEFRLLRNMPVVAEAVVAPGAGRLFPSATGPGISIPEEVFALSATLAEIRKTIAPDDETVSVTIAPGDRVEILVPDEDHGGFCLIRTRKKTYCWLSARNLHITTE